VGPGHTKGVVRGWLRSAAPDRSKEQFITNITASTNPLLRSLLVVKRTLRFALHMSASDPKRTGNHEVMKE
jgi:hypothetical protein